MAGKVFRSHADDGLGLGAALLQTLPPVSPSRTSGYNVGVVGNVAKTILTKAAGGDVALEREVRAGEEQLKTLTANGREGGSQIDEAALFRLIAAANLRVQDLQRHPSLPGPRDSDIQRLAKAILNLCTSWFRLAADGNMSLWERSKASSVAEMICSMVTTLLTSGLPFSDALLSSFNDSGGLGLFGSALCHFGEAAVPAAVDKLKRVAVQCGAYAKDKGMLARNIEAFRIGLFSQLLALAQAPGRQLRVKAFRALVADVGDILGCIYTDAQVMLQGWLLSLNLARGLAAFCPGVEEEDAIAAVDWLASVMKTHIDTASDIAEGDFRSPAVIRENLRNWIAQEGLWGDLLLHAGCSTTRQVSEAFKVLISRKVFSPGELVRSLQQAGAFPPSHITVTSRLAMQHALVVAMQACDTELMPELFRELTGILDFEHLDHEGIDLLVRVTQQAFASGYRPTAGAQEAFRVQSLAFTHLLRYLQWGYSQPEVPRKELDFAHRALLQTLAPHPALVPLLSHLAVEALALGAASSAPPEGGAHLLRCVSALGNIAVDAARIGVATTSTQHEASANLASEAVKRLCTLLENIHSKVEFNLPPEIADVWVTSFVDTLACYLRLPESKPAPSQVKVLWQALVERPVFGIAMTASASHYFKLAFLSQPKSQGALLKHFMQMPQTPPEADLVYKTYFCPASFGDEQPPISAGFFFPLMSEARSNDCSAFVQMVVTSETEAPSRSMSAVQSPSRQVAVPADTGQALGGWAGNEGAMTLAASAAGVSLPATSAGAPRLRLDQIQKEISQELFFELTGYDAIERRLWDEFATRGRIDDAEALRQRDVSAERCRKFLAAELAVAGGRATSPVSDASAKFTHLCEVINAHGLLDRVAQQLQDKEEACAKAEDTFLRARSLRDLDAARQRRRGNLPVHDSEEVTKALEQLNKLNLELIVELRLLAARSQLGLIELLTTPSLARCLRAVGDDHCDPLLERLLSNEAWLAVQAEGDSVLADVIASPETASPANVSKHAANDSQEVLEDPALARPGGLEGYSDIRTVSQGGHISMARRNGNTVALKAFSASSEAAMWRELKALSELRQGCIASLSGVIRSEGGGTSYLELAWCGGGNLHEWCERNSSVVGLVDAEAYVKVLGIFRQVWHGLAFVHGKGAAHGDLALQHVLLTADHRPVMTDFSRCYFADGSVADWSVGVSQPSPGYEAPEAAELSAAGAMAAPTQVADCYSCGVMMAKAFLGLSLEVSACQIDARTGQRDLPEELTDVDLADLLQAVVAQEPRVRLSAEAAASHRSLDPANFLRRQGLLGGSRSGATAEGFMASAEQLREEFRGKRVDEPLIFNRDAVFDAVTSSKLHEWAEEALLGEWRVVLDTESGVDAGGLRREVVTLFFEQLEQSNLVERIGADGPGVQPTLFIADRQKADQSPQQWRQTWSAVGAMILRSVVHFGNAPVRFSSSVFDCAFGRIGRMPPDEGVRDAEEDGGVLALGRLREARGDDWARSQLLDFLRRLRSADAQKDSSYRWMLGQRAVTGGHGAEASQASNATSYLLSAKALDTVSCMLDPLAYKFLIQNSHMDDDGAISHNGAVMEWALLWDLYLKYIGDGDRWTAYEAMVLGLTARGRRTDLWAPLTGQLVVKALEGADLTPEAVLGNLEYKPGYGYDSQIQFFKNVLGHFSASELSLFLRFATGIGRLPANRRFPGGQKLTIRFMPDQQDRLPTAHTCFWTVDVPPYEDELDLDQKLRQAIAAPQPFTFS